MRQPVKLAIGLITGLTLCFAAWHFYQIRNTPSYSTSPVQVDMDTSQDLYKIQTSIIQYLNSHRVNSQATLPMSLHDAGIKGLKHNLSSYEYSYKNLTSNGGPTYSFQLCATFSAAGSSNYSGGDSVEVYQKHQKGKQCFSDEYYKSESHVYPIQ